MPNEFQFPNTIVQCFPIGPLTDKPEDQNNEEPEFKEDQGDETGDKDLETFYTFKWINKQTNKRKLNKDKKADSKIGENGKSKSNRRNNKKQKVKSDKPKSFEARPEKQHKIDPDNPFAAALMDFSKKS